MSNLDKIARHIKGAKKVYDAAQKRRANAQLELTNANKAVNEAAAAVDKLRTQLAVEAEGSTPNYSLYI